MIAAIVIHVPNKELQIRPKEISGALMRHCFDCGLESRSSFFVNTCDYFLVIFKVLPLKISLESQKLTFAVTGVGERTCLIS